jgi:acyl carrier protein
MTREEMLDELRGFVVRERLVGRDTAVDEHTPRLAWGVLDSLSVNVLISFTNERFGIEVPQTEVAPQSLEDLDSYVALLARLS